MGKWNFRTWSTFGKVRDRNVSWGFSGHGREFVARHLVPFGICYELEEREKKKKNQHSFLKDKRYENRKKGGWQGSKKRVVIFSGSSPTLSLAKDQSLSLGKGAYCRLMTVLPPVCQVSLPGEPEMARRHLMALLVWGPEFSTRWGC